jgi:hypothetical protein
VKEFVDEVWEIRLGNVNQLSPLWIAVPRPLFRCEQRPFIDSCNGSQPQCCRNSPSQ